MNPTSPPRFSPQAVAEIVALLQTFTTRPHERVKRKFERVCGLWSARFITISGIFFVILLFAAGVHVAWPLSSGYRLLAVIVGIVSQVMAIAGLVLSIGQLLAGTVTEHLHRGTIRQDEFLHEYANAKRLSGFSSADVEAAGRWIDVEAKRLERWQARLFGSDKLTVLGVLALGWATWKEVGPVMQSWHFSPLLLALSISIGIVLGGLLNARRIGRLTYECEVLQLTQTIRPDPASP